VKRLLATLRLYLVAVLSTVFHAVWIVACTGLRPSTAERTCYRAPRSWCNSLLWAAGAKVELEGLEHLAPPRPAVLVCNHQSWYDVFALAGRLPVDYRFVGKKELVRVPFFGRAWVACGNIPIDRRDRGAAIRSLRKAGERLVQDRAVVVMFPEGTRSGDGQLLPFKKGAFMLALQLGVPVVPTAVAGTRAIMPKGAWSVRPGTIRVRFGEPVEVDGMTEKDRDLLMARVRRRIEALRAPALAGDHPEVEALAAAASARLAEDVETGAPASGNAEDVQDTD
jgi:1-acyl-sn-glycerol-3-phosphate acyltransferase